MNSTTHVEQLIVGMRHLIFPLPVAEFFCFLWTDAKNWWFDTAQWGRLYWSKHFSIPLNHQYVCVSASQRENKDLESVFSLPAFTNYGEESVAEPADRTLPALTFCRNRQKHFCRSVSCHRAAAFFWYSNLCNPGTADNFTISLLTCVSYFLLEHTVLFVQSLRGKTGNQLLWYKWTRLSWSARGGNYKIAYSVDEKNALLVLVINGPITLKGHVVIINRTTPKMNYCWLTVLCCMSDMKSLPVSLSGLFYFATLQI